MRYGIKEIYFRTGFLEIEDRLFSKRKREKGKEDKMTRVNIRAAVSVLLLSMCALSACKPSYGAVDKPVLTTAAAEVEIPMDFDQIHNDVLEILHPEDFPFVKNLVISGDNTTKTVDIHAEITENVSNEAIAVFLDQLMFNISNEAAIQDFRYTKSTDTEYGSFFQKYAVHYTIMQGEDTVEDVTVNPGEKFPFQA